MCSCLEGAARIRAARHAENLVRFGRRGVASRFMTCAALLVLAAAPARAQLGGAVAYVGNREVDLRWTLVGRHCTYHLIRRDGAEIARLPEEHPPIPVRTTYRDGSVVKGQTHTYEHCCVFEIEPPERHCEPPYMVTTGEVSGTPVYDLVWPEDDYALHGVVRINQGIRLTIEPGATVEGAEIRSEGNAAGTTAFPGGDIRIDGAAVRANVTFSSSGQNWVRSNSVVTGGYTTLAVRDRAALDVRNTSFERGRIELHDEAQATIVDNQFTEGQIELVVLSEPTALIKHNRFSGALASYPLYLTGGTATVEDNTFEGPGSDTVAGAITAGSTLGPPTITLKHNYFADYFKAIYAFSGTFTIEGNTLVDSAVGIHVDVLDGAPTLNVSQNCIVATDYGIQSYDSPVVARNNWWGSPSGPRHRTNPGGTGSPVTDNVDFADWLEEENCEEPEATPTTEPSPTPTPVPGSLTLGANPDAVIPVGRESTVTAEVRTASGQPLEGFAVALRLATELGSLSANECTTDAQGRCSVVYRAPEARDVHGEEGVTVQAFFGELMAETTIRFIYLEVILASPNRGARNVEPDGLRLAITFDREVERATVNSGTFRVGTAWHGDLDCDFGSLVPTTPVAQCAVRWQGEQAIAGLHVSAELPAGATGIRGHDGTFLRMPYTWSFYTVPDLQPRLIPVQISEGANLVGGRAGVLRVEAGLDEDSELDRVEAEVKLSYAAAGPFTRTHHFYPDGTEAPQALGRGNSANFYSRDGQMPIVESAGRYRPEATLTLKGPRGQIARTYPGSVDVEVRDLKIEARGFTVVAYPAAPSLLYAFDSYPWQAEQRVAGLLQRPLLQSGIEVLQDLFPVPHKVVYRPTDRVAVFRAPPDISMRNRHYLSRVIRLNGFWYVRLNAAVLVVPGEWMRQMNGGDPIFHDSDWHVCLIGEDASPAALAHCVGHLYELSDAAEASIVGYDLKRDAYVNGDHSSLGYVFSLMRRDIGLVTGPDPVWIDAGSYRNLFEQFTVRVRGAPTQATGGAAQATQWLVAGGEIVEAAGGTTGLVDVSELIDYEPPLSAPPGSGEFALVLRDGGGTLLATHTFSPKFAPPADGESYASFLYGIAAPAGVRRIELWHDETQLAVKTSSASPPTVTLIAPDGGSFSGAIAVAWDGSDPDAGAELRYRVLYSQDAGSAWDVLADDLDEEGFTFDSAAYASGEQCLIRVVASDGFFTAEAVSAPFAVVNPPRVLRMWPPAGATDAPPRPIVTAAFRDPMLSSTIDDTTFTLRDTRGAPVAASIEYDPATRQATLTPAGPLAYETSYTATLGAAITDAAGQTLGADVAWTFRVAPWAFAARCGGDCNQDDVVTVYEVMTGVNIALGILGMDACPAFDADGDAACAVDELIRAVVHTMDSCPAGPTPTATRTASATAMSTGTATPTRTSPASPSATVTPVATPTATPTSPAPSTHTPTPTVTPRLRTYCHTLPAPLSIPDADRFGVYDVIAIDDGDLVTDLDVELDVAHTWIGDLVLTLTHLNTGREVVLIDRPGYTGQGDGCGGDDIRCTLDDDAALDAETQCAATAPALGGRLGPSEALAGFEGESAYGQWILALRDLSEIAAGSLRSWCLDVASRPPPTPGGPVAPEVIDFACNGAPYCTVSFDEDFAMRFTFADADGDASSWRITAVREDGASFLIDEQPIESPSAGGTIDRSSPGFSCGGTNCPTTAFKLRLRISDATDLHSPSATVNVVVRGF